MFQTYRDVFNSLFTLFYLFLNKLINNNFYLVYNSWAKFPPSGLLEGTSSDFGAYDQCLSIEPNEVMGRAQYCMIDLSLPLPQPQPMHHNLHHKVTVIPKDIESNSSVLSADNLFTSLSAEASFFYWVSIRTAICVPNKCSQNDINSLINQCKP